MAKEIILADWLMKKLPLAERFHEILRFLIVGADASFGICAFVHAY